MSEHGDLLRLVMRETGTTQSQLSRLSGVHQPSISQFLSGRVELSDDMLDTAYAWLDRVMATRPWAAGVTAPWFTGVATS